MDDFKRPRIDVCVDRSEPIPNPQLLNGGIKIRLGETVLTRVTHPKKYDGGGEWSPEYIGLHVRSDLINLARIAETIKRSEVSRYNVMKADIESTPLYIVVEPLSDTHLRLAFQVRKTQDTAGSDVPPDAACGYPVETDAFCRAVLDACQTFFETVAELDFSPDHRSLDGLHELTNSIERELDR